MKKNRNWDSVKLWLFPLVFSVGCIWSGIELSGLDDGSDINPVSHYFRDRVITENISTYYKGNLEYLEYLGEEHVLPANKIISLGEISREYKGLFNEKIIKSIFFDDDTYDFIYREECIQKSYEAEKRKKSLSSSAFWGQLGSVILWFWGIIFGIIFLVIFILWVEDIVKFRKMLWTSESWLEILVGFFVAF